MEPKCSVARPGAAERAEFRRERRAEYFKSSPWSKAAPVFIVMASTFPESTDRRADPGVAERKIRRCIKAASVGGLFHLNVVCS
jgi:hypothetical protein